MRNEVYGSEIFKIIKGTAMALAVCFLAVVAFAGVLTSTAMSSGAIYAINQTIKVFSILLGALIFSRGEKGWRQGGAIGVLFSALSYITFSAIGGDFSLGWMVLLEVGLQVFVGVLGGIIGVNIKN